LTDSNDWAILALAVGHAQLPGRTAELAELATAIAGEGLPAVAIVGEPGIGKSRLIADALARFADHRTLIAHGRAYEFERQLPFAVLTDALDAYLGSIVTARLRALGAPHRALLAGVFPSLAEPEVTSATVAAPSQAGHAVRALLELLSADQRVVLVLDDVHWADQASLELVVHLLHRPVPATAIVLAFRPAQAPRILRQGVADACASATCAEVALGPLRRADADPLLAAIGSAERRDSIYRESGGNPFYLEQLVRAAASDASPQGDADLADVPVAVSRALAAELDALPPATRLVVDAAAVAGEPFSSDLVCAITEREPGPVRAAFDDALARGLLARTRVPGRFAFRHPIVRRAVYASAPPAWLLGAHERAAETLAVLGARAPSRAHHVELSGRMDPEATRLLVEAGRQTARVAPASAVRWYQAALRTLPLGAGAEQRLALLAPLAATLTASGQLEPARETLFAVLELMPADQTDLRLRPLVATALIERVLGRTGSARSLLLQALEQCGDRQSAAVAALELELAADRYFAADWPAMEIGARAALTKARQCGDASLIAAAGAVLGLAEVNAGRAAAARGRVTEAAQLIDRLPDSELRLHLGAVHWVGWCEHHLELYDDVLRHYELGLALGASTGQRHLLIPMLLGFVITHTWKGHLAAATSAAHEAIQSAQLVGAEPLIELTAALRCWLSVRTGGLSEAIAACVAVATDPPGAGDGERTPGNGGPHALLTQTWLGEARIEDGEPAPGREAIVAAAGGAELPAIEPSQRAYVCELLTRAELALGERATAERWGRMAEQSADDLGLRGPSAWALRARAELALADGDRTAAAQLALASAEKAGDTHPLERERSRLLAGRALALAGDAAGIELLEESHAALGEFGAHRLQALAARELRAHGRHVARTARAARGTGELAALTGRELEVATLVAEHLTNRQIADRLVLSPKTIERHMDHIFTKLDVGSRGAVARLVLTQRVR